MKKGWMLSCAAFAGAVALSLQGCCCAGKTACPPPPPCKMDAPHCQKCCCCCGHAMHKKQCKEMPDKKAGEPRRPHPGMEAFKKRMDAMKALREKCPDEMLAIDKEIIAAEDKIDALAQKEGIDMPARPADFRRLRVAFPDEMKKLDAERAGMKPGEYRKAIKELSDKLTK